MGFFDKFSRKKAFDPDERRRQLLSTGRITDGTVIDTRIDESGTEYVVFIYTLNGVDFESADELTEEQKLVAGKYALGSKIGVRFDPKNQYDSIIE